jgi:uncharacterized protein YoaH (UPF0181 family)
LSDIEAIMDAVDRFDELTRKGMKRGLAIARAAKEFVVDPIELQAAIEEIEA